MIFLTIDLDRPAADLLATGAFGAGALVAIERSAVGGGASYSQIATKPIVAGVDGYEYADQSGLTTSWYRYRYRSADGTLLSDYSDEFQAGALAAYATVEELVSSLPGLPDVGSRNLHLLADLLTRASAHITSRCGRDFYRHPQVSGTEVRLFDVSAPARRLLVVAGVVNLTSLEYASNTGGTYTALASTDWFLRPTNPEPEDSHYEILLNDQGTIGRFFRGVQVVRATGVFGYSEVPSIIRAGALALAREMYVMLPTGRGSASAGVADFGSAQVPGFLPRATYEAIEWGRRRTYGWV